MAPGHIVRTWLTAAKLTQTFVSSPANQSFKAQADSFGVSGSTTGRLGLIEECVVDVKSFLHMYDYAIKVWQMSNLLIAKSLNRIKKRGFPGGIVSEENAYQA